VVPLRSRASKEPPIPDPVRDGIGTPERAQPIGATAQFTRVLSQVAKAGPTDATALVTG
jgi:hypothetical protein